MEVNSRARREIPSGTQMNWKKAEPDTARCRPERTFFQHKVWNGMQATDTFRSTVRHALPTPIKETDVKPALPLTSGVPGTHPALLSNAPPSALERAVSLSKPACRQVNLAARPADADRQAQRGIFRWLRSDNDCSRLPETATRGGRGCGCDRNGHQALPDDPGVWSGSSDARPPSFSTSPGASAKKAGAPVCNVRVHGQSGQFSGVTSGQECLHRLRNGRNPLVPHRDSRDPAGSLGVEGCQHRDHRGRK